MIPHEPNATPRDGNAPLLAIDQALSRLAIAERAHAGAGLEERLFGATRTAIVPIAGDVAPVGRRVDDLAAAEAAAARPELEAQAFELSREAVASGRGVEAPAPWLRLAGAGPGPVAVGRTRRTGRAAWALRAAAAVTLAGAAVMALRLSTPPSGGGDDRSVAMNSAQLAETLGREMDALFEVVDTGGQETASGSLDAEPDTAWMDELFAKESL